MAAKYRLFCEYTHCCGKQILALGEVKTEDMAKNWVKRQTRTGGRPRLAEKDLILTCPVKHCPAKSQYPRYDYSPVPDTLQEG